jgi:hypothetical protein
MPYHYVDCVKLAIDTARARIPMLQESAINEFADIVSQDVMRGDWTAIEGKPLHKSGKNLESYLDHCILERTDDKGNCHWLIPEVVVEATEMWLNPTLTAQGKRWKEINAVLNDPDATNEAMAKEAAKYGCTVGSTRPGTKPGAKPAAPDAKSDPRANPYMLRADDPTRLDKIIKFLKTAKPSQVNSMALSAGCTIDGKPLARRG